MVYRDPNTGKFVSEDGEHDGQMHTMVGRVNYAIPAADLSGGSNQVVLGGSDAELINFSDTLESGETFRPAGLYVTAVARAHTTATAEGAFDATFMVSREGDAPDTLYNSSPFWDSSGIDEKQEVDIQRASDSEDSAIYIGQLASEPSAADSTNGLGLGGYNDADRRYIPGQFVGDLDADDELYAPVDLAVDNISDHGVQLDIVAAIHGYEAGDC